MIVLRSPNLKVWIPKSNKTCASVLNIISGKYCDVFFLVPKWNLGMPSHAPRRTINYVDSLEHWRYSSKRRVLTLTPSINTPYVKKVCLLLFNMKEKI